MRRQTASILIDRAPKVVFAYMDDVTREQDWQPNLRSAAQDPPGPSRIGTRKRYVSRFMGRDIENTYRITELDPGRRVVYETDEDSAVDVRSEVVWEPRGSSTWVTMTVEGRPKGFLRFLPGKVLEAAYREEIEGSLARLKVRLESADGV